MGLREKKEVKGKKVSTKEKSKVGEITFIIVFDKCEVKR